MYGSETMIWREKERSRIWDVQMYNLRGLLGMWRMDKILNSWIRELCRETKGVDEKIYVGVVMVWPCGENRERQDW